jgi:CelD/BcsL family acetyltransferase involved in cellulose biosynthesis
MFETCVDGVRRVGIFLVHAEIGGRGSRLLVLPYWKDTEMVPIESLTMYEDLEALEHLRPDWEALLDAYPLATTFSTLEWLLPWWRAFGGSDQLRVLTLRDASSSLLGIAPLTLTTLRGFPMPLHLLRLMGDGSHDSDNLDLPVRCGYQAEFSHALLDWMERNAGDWDVCQLHTLPSQSLVGTQLLDDLRVRGWKCFISRQPQSVVELPESWESYLKGISKKERGKIGLRARRLEKKYKVQIRKCAQEGELDLFLEALFELHGKHWQLQGLPGTMHSSARRQFYHELAPLLLACQRLEFWVLELEGKIVAAQFGFRHKDTVFSLQEGFDPAYSSDSVGYVLRSQVLKQVISDGIRKYDFLGGTDDSKGRWGAQVKNYLNIDFARPLTRGSLHLTIKYKSAGTKAWLRTHLPASVWQALKSVRELPWKAEPRRSAS